MHWVKSDPNILCIVISVDFGWGFLFLCRVRAEYMGSADADAVLYGSFLVWISLEVFISSPISYYVQYNYSFLLIIFIVEPECL